MAEMSMYKDFYEQERVLYEQQVRLHPKDVMAYWSLGFAYQQLGLWEKALVAYEDFLIQVKGDSALRILEPYALDYISKIYEQLYPAEDLKPSWAELLDERERRSGTQLDNVRRILDLPLTNG